MPHLGNDVSEKVKSGKTGLSESPWLGRVSCGWMDKLLRWGL